MVKTLLTLLRALVSAPMFELAGVVVATAVAYGYGGWRAGGIVVAVALLTKSLALDVAEKP